MVLERWKDLTINLPTFIPALHDSVHRNKGWDKGATCLDPAQPATRAPPGIEGDMSFLLGG